MAMRWRRWLFKTTMVCATARKNTIPAINRNEYSPLIVLSFSRGTETSGVVIKYSMTKHGNS